MPLDDVKQAEPASVADEKPLAGSVAELAALFPGKQFETYGGEAIEVRKLSMQQFGEAVSILEPVIDKMLEKLGGTSLDLMRLIAHHHKDAIKVLAVCIDKPEKWAGALPADEFTELFLRVFTLNHAFFVDSVGPRALALAEAIGLAFGDGQTNS